MQKKFDTLLEEFRRHTGINPVGVSLERCKAVYEAVNNMEEAAKRSKYTFQNIGLAVEALPEDIACSHGTLKNDEPVEKFVNYVIDAMTGVEEKRRLKEDIKELKKNVKDLEETNRRLMAGLMEREDLRTQLIQAMKAKERYKTLFARANERLHRFNDYSLDTMSIDEDMQADSLETLNGMLVDTSTGEVIKSLNAPKVS